MTLPYEAAAMAALAVSLLAVAAVTFFAAVYVGRERARGDEMQRLLAAVDAAIERAAKPAPSPTVVALRPPPEAPPRVVRVETTRQPRPSEYAYIRGRDALPSVADDLGPRGRTLIHPAPQGPGSWQERQAAALKGGES